MITDYLSARRQYLEDHPWKPVSVYALAGWGAFYLLFLVYAARNTDGFLFIDNVNLVIHEAGHPLFSYLGDRPQVWGGGRYCNGGCRLRWRRTSSFSGRRRRSSFHYFSFSKIGYIRRPTWPMRVRRCCRWGRLAAAKAPFLTKSSNRQLLARMRQL